MTRWEVAGIVVAVLVGIAHGAALAFKDAVERAWAVR